MKETAFCLLGNTIFSVETDFFLKAGRASAVELSISLVKSRIALLQFSNKILPYTPASTTFKKIPQIKGG
jgi:hypothetical protein